MASQITLLRQQLLMTSQLQEAIKILRPSVPDLEALVESELDGNLILEQLNNEMATDEKPIVWVSSSREDLKAFPTEVCSQIAYALAVAQDRGQHPDVRPLIGFAGEGLLRVAEDFDGATYCAVYTVRFEEAIYVLHAFQETSTSGVSTSQSEVTVIRQRLKRAEELHLQRIVRGGNRGR